MRVRVRAGCGKRGAACGDAKVRDAVMAGCDARGAGRGAEMARCGTDGARCGVAERGCGMRGAYVRHASGRREAGAKQGAVAVYQAV